MLIEADVTLNGKLELEVMEDAEQSVTIYQMPSKFGQGDYRGFFPNKQIFKNVKKGQTFSVPSDWYFMVLFEVDYDRWYGSQKLILRSWVSEYSASDVDLIKNAWQPTATEYISP